VLGRKEPEVTVHGHPAHLVRKIGLDVFAHRGSITCIYQGGDLAGTGFGRALGECGASRKDEDYQTSRDVLHYGRSVSLTKIRIESEKVHDFLLSGLIALFSFKTACPLGVRKSSAFPARVK
jgi:hypothetical protein